MRGMAEAVYRVLGGGCALVIQRQVVPFLGGSALIR